MSVAALYEVTRSIRMLLHSQLISVSPGAVVTLLPPGDALPEVSGVNLYLYRAAESPFAKNQPWRGDRITPPNSQPAVGLTLFYLLTPLGTRPDDASFQVGDNAHLMLGAAMLTLAENPVLNNVHLPTFDADTVLEPFLRNSFEQIKITLMPTNIEELSKIWATINQPYRLSVAYEVSLVELTPTPPAPVNGGIVTSTGLAVIALDAPRLATLNPPRGPVARIVGSVVQPNDLAIDGFGFSFPGQALVVQFGGRRVVVNSVPTPTDTSLTVTLPTALDAGPQEDVKVTLNGRTSTPLQFIISPWFANISPIRTALDGVGAAITLNGSGFTATPRLVQFESPTGTTQVSAFNSASDTQAVVAIPAGLANGIYNVRIVLNDVNFSASNSRMLEVIPRLDTPIGVTPVLVASGTVHQLTLKGARLNGGDVRLVIDGVVYQSGPNGNAAQIIFTLGRQLTTGSHSVAVTTDGHTSHTVSLVI